MEDDLTSETLVYDGNNAIYYMTDACYGYRAIIEEANSGQSIEIKSSGAYYVEPVSYTHLDVYKRQALGRP